MSEVSEAIEEIKSRLAEIAPEHEGIRDYVESDILEETKPFMQKALEAYNRRFALLNAALAALEQLEQDGHPEFPVMTISEEAFADLEENKNTRDRAILKFKPGPGPAVSLGLSAGEPEEEE